MNSKQPPVSNIALGIAGLTGALSIGLLCGCLPFYQARKAGYFNFAQIALASCSLAGLLLKIILTLPVAISLTIAIRTRAKP